MLSYTDLVRVERIALEHHRHVAPVRRHRVHHRVVEIKHALADILQSGDHVERGRLAAAGGSEQHQELLVLDIETQILQGDEAVGIALAHAFELDPRHVAIPLALDRAGGEARHDVTLEHDGENDRRDDRQHARRVDE